MKIKLISVVMVLTLIFSATIPYAALAADTTADSAKNSTSTTGTATAAGEEESTTELDEKAKHEAQLMLEKQQKELEDNIKNAEEKLAELEKDSKVTEEYIDTLDQKIGYINERLTMLENENQQIQGDINKLKPEIEENEKVLKELSEQVDKAQAELKKLEDKFQSVYDAYCMRLRVMYISGDYNILTALITCKDVSSFLTRYEMIKSVSKSDTELLKEVNDKTKEIVTKKDGLDEKLREYTNIKSKYDEQKASLVAKQKKIESNSEEIAAQKISLATDRAESDSLLAKLTAQNQQYTEFRNEDSALVEAVEKEIQDLIAGIKSPDEVTTAVKSDKPSDNTNNVQGGKSDVYSNSDAVLNMTYPVPGHYGVSAGFPNYSSGKYHGGIDFPCPTGSSVVAAQDGIVITVKRLDYSYGYYVMIYHGTDSKGRSVVTLYAHNSSILVSAGDSVKRGQQIAKSGSTGNSTGPHCHFEIRFNGAKVNPTHYLSR
ncbi:MAG: peptidoglycan DD-metalloendopeptidase family protein [Eubacterium sp.]|nr:peptidoglycan DD-metalloendopeptidase family protein [Eubacterium sp.]